MKKKALCLLSCCLLFGACFSDITGWDLSACSGNLGVCGELFLDNQENILGGSSLITVVLEQLQ